VNIKEHKVPKNNALFVNATVAADQAAVLFSGLPAFLLFPTFPTFSYFFDTFLLFPTFS